MKSRLPILSRYLILLAVLIVYILFLPFVYKILTPLTVYPVLILLKLFFSQVSLVQNTIIIDFQTVIEIIPACIAASAYLLLLILNLTTPMAFKKRIYPLLFSFIILLVLNILRITLFSALAHQNFSLFDLTHKITWYFLSTLFVILIWFLTVKLFKIKYAPFYTDINYLLRDIH